MTTRDALLASILSDPQDDNARLLYANFLEENDEPDRAAFIRVQVELARTPPLEIVCRGCKKLIVVEERVCDGCVCNSPRGVNHGVVPEWVCTCNACDSEQTGFARWGPLRRREGELRGPITYDFEKAAGIDGGLSYEWSRGFISTLTLAWSDWLRHHAALYWHPKQTVECPKCGGDGQHRGKRGWSEGTCRGECGRCRRIEQSLAATAQPLKVVNISDITSQMLEASSHPLALWMVLAGLNGERHRLDRVKCPTCGGSGGLMSDPCKCQLPGAAPPNRWTCDVWPGLSLKMPEATG